MTALIPYEDVRGLLPQLDLQDSQLDSAMNLVAGWLRFETGLVELPMPLPPEHDLYAPALELVALTVSNPEGLAMSETGQKRKMWPVSRRRDAILAEVRARYRFTNQRPSGDFPVPQPFPDPARPRTYVIERWP